MGTKLGALSERLERLNVNSASELNSVGVVLQLRPLLFAALMSHGCPQKLIAFKQEVTMQQEMFRQAVTVVQKHQVRYFPSCVFSASP